MNVCVCEGKACETAVRKEMISKKERQAKSARGAMMTSREKNHDPKKAKMSDVQ